MKNELFTKIDNLGALLAQIADLQKQADAIKDEIKEDASLSGQKYWDGAMFRATYVEQNRNTVDWKNIAKVLAIPADLIAANTKTTAVYKVEVKSK